MSKTVGYKQSERNAMAHKAIDELFQSVNNAGHDAAKLGNITISHRYNGASGEHCHATATLKLRFDASVIADSVEPQLAKY